MSLLFGNTARVSEPPDPDLPHWNPQCHVQPHEAWRTPRQSDRPTAIFTSQWLTPSTLQKRERRSAFPDSSVLSVFTLQLIELILLWKTLWVWPWPHLGMTHSVDCRMFSRLRLPLRLLPHLGSGPPLAGSAVLYAPPRTLESFRCSLKGCDCGNSLSRACVSADVMLQSASDKQPTRAKPHVWIKHLLQKVTVKPWSRLLRCCSLSLVSHNKRIL